jgi:hypothetical protein
MQNDSGSRELLMANILLPYFLLTLVFSTASDRVITPSGCAISCPSIVVKGQLSEQLQIFECKATSGMSCKIAFKRGAALPSHILIQEVDSKGKPIARRVALIYPNLKPEEKGWATFRISRANTVVLTGEWHGAWRSAY